MASLFPCLWKSMSPPMQHTFLYSRTVTINFLKYFSIPSDFKLLEFPKQHLSRKQFHTNAIVPKIQKWFQLPCFWRRVFMKLVYQLSPWQICSARMVHNCIWIFTPFALNYKLTKTLKLMMTRDGFDHEHYESFIMVRRLYACKVFNLFDIKICLKMFIY